MPFYSKIVNTYLKALGTESYRELLMLCSYEYRPRNTYIYKEQDPSNEKAFVVLRGQVRLLEGKGKPDKDSFKEVNFSQKIKRLIQVIRQRLFPVLRFAQCSRYSKMALDEEEGLEKGQSGDPARIEEPPGIYKMGQMFGMSAIGKKGKKAFRHLSAYCETEADLLVMTRKDLMSILNTFDKEKMSRYNFLHRIFPEISTITSHLFLESVLYTLNRVVYSREQFIAKQDNSGSSIYFIEEGEVEVRRRINPLYDPKSRSFVSKNHRPIDVAICHLISGQIFGEELLLDETSEVYEFSVKVYSETAKVFEVQLSQMKSKFLSSMTDKMRQFAESIKEKRRVFLERQFGTKIILSPEARVTQYKELGDAKRHLRPTANLSLKPLGTKSVQQLRVETKLELLTPNKRIDFGTLSKEKAAEIYSFSRIHILPEKPERPNQSRTQPNYKSDEVENPKMFLPLKDRIKMQSEIIVNGKFKEKEKKLDPIWKLNTHEEKILAYRKDEFHKHTRSLSTLQQSGRSVISVGQWYNHIKATESMKRHLESIDKGSQSLKNSVCTERFMQRESDYVSPLVSRPFSRKVTKPSLRVSDIFITKKNSNA